jgi:hypothetical protein
MDLAFIRDSCHCHFTPPMISTILANKAPVLQRDLFGMLNLFWEASCKGMALRTGIVTDF